MLNEKSISIVYLHRDYILYIFLLQRDKLPVHQLVALETTVTNTFKKKEAREEGAF